MPFLIYSQNTITGLNILGQGRIIRDAQLISDISALIRRHTIGYFGICESGQVTVTNLILFMVNLMRNKR